MRSRGAHVMVPGPSAVVMTALIARFLYRHSLIKAEGQKKTKIKMHLMF